MDISIIICSYNRCESLEKVLESVQGLNCPPGASWETLVVDNNSSDATKATVERFVGKGRGDIRYLFEGRQGKSHALNTGIERAAGQILAFTDDDVLFDPDWLVRIKETFDRHGCAGIGGKIIPVIDGKKPSWLSTDTPTPFLNVLGSFDLGNEGRELTVPCYGANMAYKKEVITRHGLFRFDLGPRGEDTEISLRLLARGERLRYVPDAVVYHRVQREKLEKKAFRSSYIGYGRFKAKSERESLPKGQRYCFGVPRFLYKTLLKKWLKWLFNFDPKLRVRDELEFYECVGRALEYLATRNSLEPSTIKTNGVKV